MFKRGLIICTVFWGLVACVSPEKKLSKESQENQESHSSEVDEVSQPTVYIE